MADELPNSIIISPAHQQTLVKNLLMKLKVWNRLIYDRVSQSKQINMNQIIHHLLRIDSDAIRTKQDYAQLQASSMASIRAPCSAPGTSIQKKQKTLTTPNNMYGSQCSSNAITTTRHQAMVVTSPQTTQKLTTGATAFVKHIPSSKMRSTQLTPNRLRAEQPPFREYCLGYPLSKQLTRPYKQLQKYIVTPEITRRQ